MVEEQAEEWPLWVVLLALGGFVGNFVLCLADHAQNGFWQTIEWVPVIGAAFAFSFLLVPLMMRVGRGYVLLCLALMGVEVLIGLIGEGLHLWSDFHGTSSSLWQNFLFGAPAFAPLLFPNLAGLAGIGLWAMYVRQPEGEAEGREVEMG